MRQCAGMPAAGRRDKGSSERFSRLHAAGAPRRHPVPSAVHAEAPPPSRSPTDAGAARGDATGDTSAGEIGLLMHGAVSASPSPLPLVPLPAPEGRYHCVSCAGPPRSANSAAEFMLALRRCGGGPIGGVYGAVAVEGEPVAAAAEATQFDDSDSDMDGDSECEGAASRAERLPASDCGGGVPRGGSSDHAFRCMPTVPSPGSALPAGLQHGSVAAPPPLLLKRSIGSRGTRCCCCCCGCCTCCCCCCCCWNV